MEWINNEIEDRYEGIEGNLKIHLMYKKCEIYKNDKLIKTFDIEENMPLYDEGEGLEFFDTDKEEYKPEFEINFTNDDFDLNLEIVFTKLEEYSRGL